MGRPDVTGSGPDMQGGAAPAGSPGARTWVGIGASAGGLEAIRDLVRNLSPDLDATYVVLQHMAPSHRSLLSVLIGRETALPTAEIADGIEPRAGHIYVAPPNHDVTAEGGRLRLWPPSREPASPKPSVDRFFVSLAEAAGPRAVGIVLSGTGSDGAYGVQAIRAGGGITIAQDETTAKYDGMPAAAVGTGCVDLVLEPAAIGAKIGRIVTTPRNLDPFRRRAVEDGGLSDLLQILLARTRVDFRDYKATTVLRRIDRRMAAIGIADLAEYTRFVRAHPREADMLFKDLLISVTRFFRDPEEFAVLGRELAARLGDGGRERPVRAWVAGCATGEEAYSVAMLIAEAFGGPEAFPARRLQLFATDIDQAALRTARAGQYPAAALDSVPEALVARYFRRSEDGFSVIPKLKDSIIFSEHNVFQDPPFLHLDLVCCRNLLIYFNPQLQSRVLTRFDYALEENGLLFLGTAEGTAGAEASFRAVGEGTRVFRRRSDASPLRRARDLPAASLPRLARAPAAALADLRAARALVEALVRALGPDALLVAADLRIVEVFGDVTRFLELRDTTRPQMSLSMLREPLAHEARSLVALALRTRVLRTGLRRARPEEPGRSVQLTAYPLEAAEAEEGLALVTFREWSETAADPAPSSGATAAEHVEISALKREVAATREALQQTVEELETSNEELQALNEELQSTNEELQATNEELETANEELQSANEELITVNEEQQIGAAELSALNEELGGILATLATPLLVVDSSLHVTRASEEARALFGIASVADRPHVSHLRLPPGLPPLADLFAETLRRGRLTDTVATGPDGRWTIRCAPFADARGHLIGASAVFAAPLGPAPDDGVK